MESGHEEQFDTTSVQETSHHQVRQAAPKKTKKKKQVKKKKSKTTRIMESSEPELPTKQSKKKKGTNKAQSKQPDHSDQDFDYNQIPEDSERPWSPTEPKIRKLIGPRQEVVKNLDEPDFPIFSLMGSTRS